MIVYVIFCRRALAILKAHKAMILARGIDPEHTPTQRKILMLRSVRTCGFLDFLFVSLSTMLYASGLIAPWVLDILCAILTALLYGLMTYRCRIRSKMTAIYGDDQAAYIVSDAGSGLVPWRPDMVLPKLPRESHLHHKIHAGNPDDDWPPEKPAEPDAQPPKAPDDEAPPDCPV
jgi:hypothetical protein